MIEQRFNLEVMKLRNSLADAMNSSNLPISVKSMVVKDIFEITERNSAQQIMEELKDYQAEQEEEYKKKKAAQEVAENNMPKEVMEDANKA